MRCGEARRTVEGTNFPGPNNPVVIGNVANSHVVTVDADSRRSASLVIATNSTLDCNTRTSLTFGPYQGDNVNEKGLLRLSAVVTGSGVFPGGDFTNFIGPNGGTVEWYGATKNIPATSGSLVLDNYYNLKINPTNGQTISLPQSNLTIYNDLTITMT
jgi:hypothetical protein